MGCSEPALCKGTGVETIDVWYGTDLAWLDLTNKNGADLVGSLIFQSPHGTRKFWKRYSVNVNTRYGPWGDCNYVDGRNVCVHDLPPYVGRGGGQALSGSQCGPATSVGLWYSFPEKGKC